MAPAIQTRQLDGFSFREAGARQPGNGEPALLALHGFPTCSYLWRHVLEALGQDWYAVALDLPGFGDSPPRLPGTWEQQVENVTEFHRAAELGQVVLIVHDWGGLIGLRWACENPTRVRALVIMDTGFFPDGKWHGMAKTLQTEGEGEKFMDQLNEELFRNTMKQLSTGMTDDAVGQYWHGCTTPENRQSHLDLYRSGDMSKLNQYDGKLSQLEVPSLILWGADDPFAPVSGAYRFDKELKNSKLVIFDDAGHYLPEDRPQEVATEIGSFLQE